MSAVTRERNLFGYLSGVQGIKIPSPRSQLRTLLNLENHDKLYVHIRTTIIQLTIKHMDVKLMGTEQRDNLRAIKTELKEQFPEIFAAEESDKRLYFVGRMVLHDHASRRSQIKRQKKEAQRHRNMVPRKTRTQRNHQQEDGDIQVQEPRNLNHHPPPLPLPPHDPNQYQAIHGFLQASKPPMTHLMDVFVNFGCINTDFLLAISSWSSERIRGLLDRLPPGPDGKKVTEMDKFILQNHIKEYFAQL